MASDTTSCPRCGLVYTGGEVFCPEDGARLVANGEAKPDPAPARPDPLLGQVLSGRYRIVRRIGEGGMGIVYEAEHVMIEKRVALKLLREDFSHRPDVVERFRQEARSASRIGHEHIIDVSDFGVAPGGRHFFVMELLCGHDLAEELARTATLSPRRVLTIALQCARALGAAHAKGIIHRDIKPENIFLVQREGGEEFIKIVDFGIAKMSDIESHAGAGRRLTKTGMVFGTPEYMSPEQAAGKPYDGRADIYGLGIIMYELLTGQVPFTGDTFMGILTQHMLDPIPPLRARSPGATIPEDVERIVMRAVAKEPEARFQSMEELALALSAALAQVPASASSLAPPPGTITHCAQAPSSVSRPPEAALGPALAPGARRPGRRPITWLAAALALLCAGAAASLFYAGQPRGRAARDAGVSAAPGSGTEVAPAAVAAPATEARPTLAPAPKAPPTLAPSKVIVEVRSQPSGATIHVGGKEACAPTPCTFSAEQDAIVHIEATRSGYRPSRTEIRAVDARTAVTLKLRKRPVPRRRSGTRLEGDLLIPDAFGNP